MDHNREDRTPPLAIVMGVGRQQYNLSKILETFNPFNFEPLILISMHVIFIRARCNMFSLCSKITLHMSFT